MDKTCRVSTVVQLPIVPSYLRIDHDNSVTIGSLDDRELKELGELWTEALIEKAKKQRENQ